MSISHKQSSLRGKSAQLQPNKNWLQKHALPSPNFERLQVQFNFQRKRSLHHVERKSNFQTLAASCLCWGELGLSGFCQAFPASVGGEVAWRIQVLQHGEYDMNIQHDVVQHTVDGRNPAPVDMVSIPLFTWFYTSQVVQDFFHQQYHHWNVHIWIVSQTNWYE